MSREQDRAEFRAALTERIEWIKQHARRICADMPPPEQRAARLRSMRALARCREDVARYVRARQQAADDSPILLRTVVQSVPVTAAFSWNS